MNDLLFVRDYKSNEQLRKSFFELSHNIFGLNFENWYKSGFWDNRYIPFSFIDGNKVVANVSITKMDLIIQGKKHSAIQIGTVMTHPDYRNRGLSTKLMNKVINEYEGSYDFIYLFANENVVDFYPRFGFYEVDEYQYSMNITNQSGGGNIHQLDMTNLQEVNFVYKFVTERLPVSQTFSTGNSCGIFMYYCLNVLTNDIYYLESDDAIVIFEKNENQLDLFDIISKTEVDIENIIAKISDNKINKVVFHFTPDLEGYNLEINKMKREGALFMKTTNQTVFAIPIKHPITSEA